MYIKREDAIKAIRKCKFEHAMPSSWYVGMEMAQDIIKSLPSADVAGRYENAIQKLREMPKYLNGVKEKQITKISDDEVVRCKDCKYRKKNKFCLEHNRYEKDDDGYCHYGERGTYERK